jgi:cell division protein FtsZ
MSLNLSIPDEEQELKPRITVVGVGGAGGNAVSNMVRSGLIGCEFIVCNTDSQALRQSLAERRIQLGVGVTRGLGAGSRPEIGRIAAEEALEEIMHELDGSNMVFITAGMGGGTGTGAAPVIARAAREAGILTVGVVTKPFHFEGTNRMRLAEAGITELQKFVDTLIVIPNQNLFRVANERTTFADAFKMADDVLASGVRGVTDLMIMPGLINLDFADIRAVMSEMGKAMMGTGEAEGDRRSIDAAEAAISNPLLEDVSMKGARGVLINITGGLDMTLFEVDEAANRIREEVDAEANIIFGSTFDEKLAGKMRISVVATGLDLEGAREPRPVISLVSDRSHDGTAKTGSAAKQEAPASALAALEPAAPAFAVEPDLPQVAAAEQAAIERAAGFVPQRPAVAPPARPPALTAPLPPLSPALQAKPQPAPAKPKGRMPSLFERVTNASRLMRRDDPPPPPRVAPAAPAQAPRLGPADPADRISTSRSEEEVLDIPAFLRRQAN